MIVDTDSHNVCVEVFKQVDSDELVQRLIDNCQPMDLNPQWAQMYKEIQDPSWPECGTIDKFHQLPLHIRKELRDLHNLGLGSISKDLNTLYLDHEANAFPTLKDQANACKHFLKVDRQVVNTQVRASYQTYSTEKSLAVNIMHTFNSGMTQVCKDMPLFDFNLWLAVQDLDASMQELFRYVDKDFFGVYLDERMPWAWVDKVFPLLKFCADNKLPVYFHLTHIDGPPLDWTWDRSNPRWIAQKNRWPKDAFLGTDEVWKANIASLITEGIFDRLPNLRVIIAEKGISWIPAMREFMLEQKWPDPLFYFRNNFWFTTEPEELNFFKNAALVGWDRLLFSTDYPHNDKGGKNRFHDVDLINSYLHDQKISQQQYDLYTHKNYLHLKTR